MSFAAKKWGLPTVVLMAFLILCQVRMERRYFGTMIDSVRAAEASLVIQDGESGDTTDTDDTDTGTTSITSIHEQDLAAQPGGRVLQNSQQEQALVTDQLDNHSNATTTSSKRTRPTKSKPTVTVNEKPPIQHQEKRQNQKQEKTQNKSSASKAPPDDDSAAAASIISTASTTTAASIIGSPAVTMVAAPNNNNNSNVTFHIAKRTSPVLLATYVFGRGSVYARRFRMFIESARYCGFDIVLVGDTRPPFDLPPNVHHFPTTWRQFVQRVYDRVLHMPMPKSGGLQKAGFYKVCDFKPLLAYLFPEVVDGYEWWGHIDNDMILGNLTKFFTPDMLRENDIISGDGISEKHKSWGPFTLYRNTPVVNTLWKKIELDKPLKEVFGDAVYHYFDEWNNPVRGGSRTSMTGMIKLYAKSLGINHTHERTGSLMWDKHYCRFMYKKGEIPERCAECTFHKGTLMFLQSHLDFEGKETDKEVFLCHYQGSKKINQEPSLFQGGKFQHLIADEAFRVSYKEGFDYYNLEDPRRPKLLVQK